MRKYKKTNRKNNKTRKARKSRKYIKHKFRQIGAGNIACLYDLQAKYGKDVFYTDHYHFGEVYSDAIKIKNKYPGVKILIEELPNKIPNFDLGNKDLDNLICDELNAIQRMIPEFQNIFLPLLIKCSRYPYDFFCKDKLHYDFLLEYLGCLISFMNPGKMKATEVSY